jgi:hypothetical protein
MLCRSDLWPDNARHAGAVTSYDLWPDGARHAGAVTYYELWPDGARHAGAVTYYELWPDNVRHAGAVTYYSSPLRLFDSAPPRIPASPCANPPIRLCLPKR